MLHLSILVVVFIRNRFTFHSISLKEQDVSFLVSILVYDIQIVINLQYVGAKQCLSRCQSKGKSAFLLLLSIESFVKKWWNKWARHLFNSCRRKFHCRLFTDYFHISFTNAERWKILLSSTQWSLVIHDLFKFNFYYLNYFSILWRNIILFAILIETLGRFGRPK